MLGGRNKEKTGDAYAAAVILRRVVRFYNAFDENIEICNVCNAQQHLYVFLRTNAENIRNSRECVVL